MNSLERVSSRRKFIERGVRFSLTTLALYLLESCSPSPDSTQSSENNSQAKVDLAAVYKESLNLYETQSNVSLDFSQMSSGTPIESTIFSKEMGVFNETLEVNTPDNVEIQNGALELRIRRTESGLVGSRLSSRNKLDFQTGLLEITLELPRDKEGKDIPGAFPGVWLQSSDQSHSSMGPSANGEVDIFEYQGGRPNYVFSTMHTYDSAKRGKNPNGGQIVISDLLRGAHTFGVLINDAEIIFTARKAEQARDQAIVYHRLDRNILDPSRTDYEKWPIVHNFHLMINYSAGGKWATQIAAANSLDPVKYPGGVDMAKIDNSVLRILKIEKFDKKQN